jgi:hypothetical protein
VQGCPAESLGEVGRGKGSLVDLDAVRRWRAEKYGVVSGPRQSADVLSIVAGALVDALKRDRAHERVNIKEGPASGLLAIAYQRIWMNVTRQSVESFQAPKEIEQLCAIYVQWTQDPHHNHRG